MNAIVEVEGISKSYGATRALAGVDLAIERGSVHALVGENGAGKSTLGKVISGVIAPDAGRLRVAGQDVAFRSPRDAISAGVTAIQQEITLVPASTVIDNVLLGLEPRRAGFVARGRARALFADLCRRTRFALDPDRTVRTLSLADQQKVEILRALARGARVLVMDEPTASLGAEEKAQLVEIVRDLCAAGTTVIYVSHFLDEVLEMADTVTVLRDGTVVRTRAASAETTRSLVEAMLGRQLSRVFPPKAAVAPSAPIALAVDGLTRRGSIAGISFGARAGEIVGIAGLDGSGRESVTRVMFGDLPADAGTIALDGARVRPRSPRHAMRAGMAFVPAERKSQGLILDQSVLANVLLPRLGDVSRAGLLGPHAGAERVAKIVGEVGVRPPAVATRVGALSGGNQQKTLFAKWIYDRPRVLLIDEPTRGVDIDGKQAVYDLLARLAADGMALVVASSDMEEILGLCQRVLVMRRGRIAAELRGDEINEHAVMSAAFDDGKGGH